MKLANNLAFGASATVFSSAIPVGRSQYVGFQITATQPGNPAFQASHDGVTWHSVSVTGIAVMAITALATAGAKQAYVFENTGYQQWRVQFTNTNATAGTVTVDAFLAAYRV